MSVQHRNLLELSAKIVAAHAGNNPVAISVLPEIIRNVYKTLAELYPNGASAAPVAEHTHSESNHSDHDHDMPASISQHNAGLHPTYGQTVFSDHLICMEDGLTMKMLKRHLLTVHGMTPDEYRAKWGLPSDYPMVAAEYAKLRSSLALQSGLGLKPADRPAKGRKPRKG